MKVNKKQISAIIVIILVVVISLFIFNKNNSNDQIVLTTTQNQETFNPYKVDSVSDNNIIQQTVATLMRYDKNGNIVPHAAKKITLSDDKKVVNVELKKGLFFENGEKVTAKDYYLGAKVFASPQTQSSYSSWILDWVEGAQQFAEGKSKEISGIVVKNDYEFSYNLTKPVGFFKNVLVNTYFGPVSEKQIKSAGGIKKYAIDLNTFVSSGTMKYKKYVKNQYIELEKNEKSILSKDAKVQSYKVRYISDTNTVAKLFKNGEINDVVKSELSDKILNYTKNQKTTYQDSEPTMTWLVTNTQNVNSKLAQALYLAIDKEYINKNFNYKQGIIRSVMTPQGENFKDLDNQLEKLNVKTNANLFNFKSAQEIVKNNFANKKIRFLIDADQNTDSKFSSLNKYLVSTWRKLGLDVEEKVWPSKVMSNEILKEANTNRNYEVAIKSWSPDYLEASSFTNSVLGTKSSTNYANWTNEEFDQNNQQAMSLSDIAKANEFYAKNVKLAQQENLLQPIYQKNSSYYVKKNGFIVNKLGLVLMTNEWIKSK